MEIGGVRQLVYNVGRVDVRWKVSGILAIVLAIGLAIYFAGARAEFSQLTRLGYPGVFLISMIAGGSMLFPVPSQFAIVAAGVVLNPFLVGIAAGMGNATGEFTGYLAGLGGRAVLLGPQKNRFWRRLEEWLAQNGFFGLVLFAAIPNPVFDVAGVLAGSLGYSPRRFWLACFIGNTIKYTAMAYLGEAAVLRAINLLIKAMS